MTADYYAFLRYEDLEDSVTAQAKYARSKRKGKFQRLVDARRRREFSPGRYYATSPTGFYLNRNFVKGSSAAVLAQTQL